MITQAKYESLRKRFKQYIQSLPASDEFILQHIQLKISHTYHVVRNSHLIARLSQWAGPDIIMAKTIGLLHDLGRFEQFIEFRTFDDSLSVNHAQLGIEISEKKGFISCISDPSDRNMVTQTILNHNIASILPDTDRRVGVFARLLRDADKLDIWRLLTEMNVVNKILPNKDPMINEASEYRVPASIVQCFRNRSTVSASEAKTMNDFRLQRLSWIFDMNFRATFVLLRQRNYIEKILSRIPRSPEVDEIACILHAYAEQKLLSQSDPGSVI
jgi:putative nucleotidyltransferase with HDIG domain